jgi:transposase
MTITPAYVGIDISKHHLDVFDGKLGRSERLANDDASVALLAARFADSGAFVVFEATGHYDARLRQALAKASVPFARVNPTRARDFARAAGFLAKTDAVDARMLTALGHSLRPPADQPTVPERDRLALLHKRRDQLVATRKQERTRLRECHEPTIAASIETHLAWLDHAIAALEATIAALIKASPQLLSTARLLRSVPGIGPVNVATLLALAPELGDRSPKRIAALAGLAPLNVDSGQSRGRRSIRGGRKRLRDALYVAAVVASRSKGRFGNFYRALRQAGKTPKLAFIALARKILVTLNAIVRDRVPFHA